MKWELNKFIYYVTWVPLSMNIHRFVYRSYWLWNSAFFGEFNWRRDLWEFFCYGPRGAHEYTSETASNPEGVVCTTLSKTSRLSRGNQTPLLTPLGSCCIACIRWFVVTVAGLEATNFHLNSTRRWTFLLILSTITTTTIMCCLLHFKNPR